MHGTRPNRSIDSAGHSWNKAQSIPQLGMQNTVWNRNMGNDVPLHWRTDSHDKTAAWVRSDTSRQTLPLKLDGRNCNRRNNILKMPQAVPRKWMAHHEMV